MPEPDHATTGALAPRELIDLLDRVRTAGEPPANIDFDAIWPALDPRRLGRNDLATLLDAATRYAPASLSAVEATTFARILTHASRAQVDAVLVDPALRAAVLDEVFRRMGSHLRADEAADVDAVIHWRLSEGTGDGGFDRYESVIRAGVCTVGRDMVEIPRVTLTLAPADLLKLITGNASAPVLFMLGKLKVRGDLAFATGLIGLFELPRA